MAILRMRATEITETQGDLPVAALVEHSRPPVEGGKHCLALFCTPSKLCENELHLLFEAISQQQTRTLLLCPNSGAGTEVVWGGGNAWETVWIGTNESFSDWGPETCRGTAVALEGRLQRLPKLTAVPELEPELG